MNRRTFVRSLAAAPAALAQGRKPNIILIMADDMGFSDIGCYGGEVATPNLDRLAAGGVRFTQFYNNARCCPTRASLLTGLYSHQAGIGAMVSDHGLPAYRGFLNGQCATIAEALKPAGYRTYMAGKWHVGEKRPHWPCDRGFDRYFGLISGASNFFTVDPERQMALDNEPWRPAKPGFYMTEAFTDHAVKFLGEHKTGQPFFLYLAYTSPHWPLHALPEDIEKYRDRYKGGWEQLRTERHARMVKMGLVDRNWKLPERDPRFPAWADAKDKEWEMRRMAVYAAQIDRMDRCIGRVLDQVKAMGQEDNTLILFLADNGGCAETLEIGFRGKQGVYKTLDGREVRLGNDPKVMPGPADTFQSYGPAWASASNTPFRRYKSFCHEGGIATPLIAHWPARMKKGGSLNHSPGHLIDVMPTCLEAAGARYPEGKTPLPGRSLLPALSGRDPRPHDALFWEHGGNRAVRQGRWKLVSEKPGNSWELYDLAADRTETTDLATKDPARAQAMAALWQKWADRVGVVEPSKLPKRGGGE